MIIFSCGKHPFPFLKVGVEENGGWDEGKQRRRRRREAEVLRADADSGFWGGVHGSAGDPQAQRPAHVQPYC